MINRIVCFIKKDTVNALRDNVIVYVLMFPIIMALVFRIFLPSIQQAKLNFAVDNTVGKGFIQSLKDYGNVQSYSTRESLIHRVEMPDDVPGIVLEGDKYTVVLEGNEAQNLGHITGHVIDRIAHGSSLAQFSDISMNWDKFPLRNTMASVLVLAAVLVAGILMGLNIIDEKENSTIRTIAVSPMRMFEYIGSRLVSALILSIVLPLISSIILVGWDINYGKIVLGTSISVVLAMVVGLLTGGLADSQMSGMAVIKILMLFMIWIPIGASFLPPSYQWVFYIFPHYWVFQIFQNVFAGGEVFIGYWESCGAALITGSLFLICMLPLLKRKLKLR